MVKYKTNSHINNILDTIFSFFCLKYLDFKSYGKSTSTVLKIILNSLLISHTTHSKAKCKLYSAMCMLNGCLLQRQD